MASCSCATTLLCCKYLFLSLRDFHYFYNRFETNTKIKNQFKTKNYTTFTIVKILNHIQMLKSVIQHLNISQKQIAIIILFMYHAIGALLWKMSTACRVHPTRPSWQWPKIPGIPIETRRWRWRCSPWRTWREDHWGPGRNSTLTHQQSSLTPLYSASTTFLLSRWRKSINEQL